MNDSCADNTRQSSDVASGSWAMLTGAVLYGLMIHFDPVLPIDVVVLSWIGIPVLLLIATAGFAYKAGEDQRLLSFGLMIACSIMTIISFVWALNAARWYVY